MPKRTKREERRSPKYGKPTSKKAKVLGRRKHEYRVLREADLKEKIKPNWVENVKEVAKSLTTNLMEMESISRGKAIRILGANNIFVARMFGRGDTEYILRFSFKDGKFYWSSTRREARAPIGGRAGSKTGKETR